jgi:hypothetical protein
MMMRPGTIYRGLTDTVRDPFSTDTTGLPAATRTHILDVADGESFDLRAGPVRKQLGEVDVRIACLQWLHSGTDPESYAGLRDDD